MDKEKAAFETNSYKELEEEIISRLKRVSEITEQVSQGRTMAAEAQDITFDLLQDSLENLKFMYASYLTLAEKLEQEKEVRREVEAERDDLVALCDDSDEAHLHVSEDYQDLKEEFDQLAGDYANLVQEYNRLRRQGSALQWEITDSPYVKELEAKVERLEREKEEEVRAERKNAIELTSQIYGLEKERDQWKRKYHDLERHHNKTTRSFFGLFYDPDKATFQKIADIQAREIQELKNERDYYKEQCESLEFDLVHLNAVIEDYEEGEASE